MIATLPNFNRAVALLAGVGVCFFGTAFADLKTSPDKKKKKKDEEERYLPEAKSINAGFIAGMSVEVELDAATSHVGPASFLIREAPKNGVLSAVRGHPKDLHKAIVIYTHTGDSTALSDQFTYACRVGEGSWSAPAVVNLIGRRADPKIEIISMQSFPRVLPGHESSARVVLKNSGVAPFAADVHWEAPWIGPPRIELAIGEQKEYLIAVRPSVPGTLTWETELQPGEPLSKIKLWVECTQSFVVAPGHLKLQFDPEGGNRRGKFSISNVTDQAIQLKIEPPDRVDTLREIEVKPKSASEVVVTMAPDDVKVFHGELWVNRGPYRERILIDAAPEPAQARLMAPDGGSLNLGTVEKGKTALGKITLANLGGEASVLSSQAAPPFRVAESDSTVSLAPGENREIVIEALPERAGTYEGSVVFSGTGGKLEVALKVAASDPGLAQPMRPTVVPVTKKSRQAVAADAPKSAPPPALVAKANPPPLSPLAPPMVATMPAVAQTSGSDSVQGEAGQFGFAGLSNTDAAVFGYLSMFGMPVPKQMLSERLQKIPGIELVKRASDYLIVAWKEQAEKPANYRLEQGYRVRNKATGLWLKAWREPDKAEKIKGEAGKVTMRLNNLVPEAAYELRVLAIDEGGKVSEPSDIHIFTTTEPWRMPSWWWQILAVIALGMLGYFYYRLKTGKWQVD